MAMRLIAVGVLPKPCSSNNMPPCGLPFCSRRNIHAKEILCDLHKDFLTRLCKTISWSPRKSYAAQRPQKDLLPSMQNLRISNVLCREPDKALPYQHISPQSSGAAFTNKTLVSQASSLSAWTQCLLPEE